MEEAVRQGVAFKADTLEELAQKAGFETKGFLSDVKAYNQAVSSGKDPFGNRLNSSSSRLKRARSTLRAQRL